MRQFSVYIMASRSRCLYVGVTNNLPRRVAEHRRGEVGHTARYRIQRLVYVETTTHAVAAITREKEIKAWRRSKKVALIVTANPKWLDLAKDWTVSSRV